MVVEVRCDDLDEAVDAYQTELGFRLESIHPAHAPNRADLSIPGLSVRLAGPPRSRGRGNWVAGRAGMRYRDLVPDRLAGRVIASHIAIPDGGPVPDYVHHHRVDFQMIFVHRGWVRVVYEDQGPPFVMGPGDCVLQPPGIRHRVLESSDGLEVIEVSSPAEHLTVVDHDVELPTARIDRGRTYGQQRFHRHRHRRTGRGDLGIEDASGGVAAARNGAPVDPVGETLWVGLAGRLVVDGAPFGVGDARIVDGHTSFETIEAVGDEVDVLQVRLPAE